MHFSAELSETHWTLRHQRKNVTLRHQTHSAEMSWVRSVLGLKCPYTQINDDGRTYMRHSGNDLRLTQLQLEKTGYAQIPLGSTRSTCRAHAFWLCRASRTAQLDLLDTTSSLAWHDELDKRDLQLSYDHRNLFIV